MVKRCRVGLILAILLGVASAADVDIVAQPQPVQDIPGRINPLIARLEQGGIADSEVWTLVDMEHNPYDITQLRATLDGFAAKRKPDGMLEKAPIVRVPMYGHEPSGWAALQVLDIGALGVIFQSIETKQAALSAIRSMRFPPQKGAKAPVEPRGFRSGGPRGGKTLPLSVSDLLRRADVWPLNPEGELFSMIMIETIEGVKNATDILSVPGIGSVLVGPFDLSLSLGEGPPAPGATPYAPSVEAAFATVAKACAARKVICGIAAAGGPEYRKKLIGMGYRIFN